MLTITIPPKESEAIETFNNATSEFGLIPAFKFKGATICLEHSLVSVSKWEDKYHKPFLGTEHKTPDEVRYYVKCMTITQNVNPIAYECLTEENLMEIRDYIKDKHTATTFNNIPGSSSPGYSKQIITSEIIYYWMIEFGVPFECQKWNLNRLLTLIRVCSVKESGGKKMSRRDILSQNSILNAARKKRLHTRG